MKDKKIEVVPISDRLKELKYTKGTWRIFGGRNVETDGGLPICSCGTLPLLTDASKAANKANAKLISAAPDMLEALMHYMDDHENAYKKAEYALKKATE